MKESTLQRKILDKLNAIPECLAIPTTVGLYGRKGEPDIMGCYKGRMFVIEVKTPGGKATPIQRKRLREWMNAGAMCAVISCDEMVDEFLKSFTGAM